MIKVILVDDEDIERDAMAEIIPWEKLDMELVDTAWNLSLIHISGYRI